MKFQKHNITTILAHLLECQAAVVFCGSGINQEPPSALPGWKILTNYTIEAIAARGEQIRYLQHLSSSACPETIASCICREGSDGYWECLQAWKEVEVNINHKYLARMARAGNVRYILTTNFDMFLEQAFQQEGLRYQVYRSEEEFASFGKEQTSYDVQLLKLHGCISMPETILAAAEQKRNHLSPCKVYALDRLWAQYHFIFLGYSGADLAMNLDYLRMVKHKRTARGFVWNFLGQADYQEPVPPAVAAIAELYQDRAHIMHSRLPELFDTLIAEEDQIPRQNYPASQSQDLQEHKNQELQASLSAWAKKQVGIGQAYTIFADIFSYTNNLDYAISDLEIFAQMCQATDQLRELFKALSNLGSAHLANGDPHCALKEYEKAENLAQSQGWCKEAGEIRIRMGNVLLQLQAFKEALTSYEKARETAQALCDLPCLATIFHGMGEIYQKQKDYEQALTCYEKAREIALKLGNQQAIIQNLNCIGAIHQIRKNYDPAMQCYEESKKIAKTSGMPQDLAACLSNLGTLHQDQGKHQEALGYYQEARKIFDSIGDGKGVADQLITIGGLYQAKREPRQAVFFWATAKKIIEAFNDTKELAIFYQKMGLIYRTTQDFYQAFGHLQKAWALAKSHEHRYEKLAISNNITALYDEVLASYEERQRIEKMADMGHEAFAKGDKELAVFHYQNAVEKAQNLKDEPFLAFLYQTLGNAHEASNNFFYAHQQYVSALKLLESSDNMPEAGGLSQKMAVFHEKGLVCSTPLQEMEAAAMYYQKAVSFFHAAHETSKALELEPKLNECKERFERAKIKAEEARKADAINHQRFLRFCRKTLSDGSLTEVVTIIERWDHHTLEAAKEELESFERQGGKHIVFVFSQPLSCGSRGMGLLVQYADDVLTRGGRLVLVGLPEKAIQVFEMLGLKDFFLFCATEEEAFKILESGTNSL